MSTTKTNVTYNTEGTHRTSIQNKLIRYILVMACLCFSLAVTALVAGIGIASANDPGATNMISSTSTNPSFSCPITATATPIITATSSTTAAATPKPNTPTATPTISASITATANLTHNGIITPTFTPAPTTALDPCSTNAAITTTTQTNTSSSTLTMTQATATPDSLAATVGAMASVQAQMQATITALQAQLTAAVAATTVGQPIPIVKPPTATPTAISVPPTPLPPATATPNRAATATSSTSVTITTTATTITATVPLLPSTPNQISLPAIGMAPVLPTRSASNNSSSQKYSATPTGTDGAAIGASLRPTPTLGLATNSDNAMVGLTPDMTPPNLPATGGGGRLNGKTYQNLMVWLLAPDTESGYSNMRYEYDWVVHFAARLTLLLIYGCE